MEQRLAAASPLRRMTPVRGALILAATALALVATPADAQTPDVTLPFTCTDQKVAPARVILTTGHGAPRDEYLVRVHLRLRVCAVRGRAGRLLSQTVAATLLPAEPPDHDPPGVEAEIDQLLAVGVVAAPHLIGGRQIELGDDGLDAGLSASGPHPI